jgi:hypothetical protein
LSGRVQAYLATQPGNVVLVNTLQQFRGGSVSNILPSQMPQIVHGLSIANLPRTKDQQPQNGVTAGLELANAPFTAVGASGSNVVPGVPISMVAPILPGNTQIKPVQPPPPQKCAAVVCAPTEVLRR